MISLKLHKTGINILTLTISLTYLLPVTTVVAEKKTVFVPPILSSPRRLIPAGTRVYEPASGENTGRNSEVQPAQRRGIDIYQDAPASAPAPAPITVPYKKVPDNCLQGELPLTALIPQSQIGLTTQGNPTLFFYLPQTSAPELELLVQDEKEQEIYKQKYKPSGKAGIISLRLPVNSIGVKKQYKWKFSVICNPANNSQNKVVAGLLERVSPNPQLVKKLQQVTRQERAAVYAEAGIWHDTLATVAQMRFLHPHNKEFTFDWEGLLTGVGVGFSRQLAQQPLVSPPEALQPEKNRKS
jgi:Domain of Unknown Function (DUF928)